MSQLLEEGGAMHHCVADYAEACAEGRYLVFSIRERWGGRRVATFGLMLENGDWVADQFRAFANADVARCVWPIARYVREHVNAVASRQPQLQHAA
ncbi:MAG TPA: PcfJ domain-containing protein [Nevskiaceae bacterium]|nr:PcfJ domain-containing protein [Nevskiaceae bacterium]